MLLHRLHSLLLALFFVKRTKVNVPPDACPVLSFYLLTQRSSKDGSYYKPDVVTSNAAKLAWTARAVAFTVMVNKDYPSGDFAVPTEVPDFDEFQHAEQRLLPFLSHDKPTPFASVCGLAAMVRSVSSSFKALPRVIYTCVRPGASALLVDDLPLSRDLLIRAVRRLQTTCGVLLDQLYFGWDHRKWAAKVQLDSRLAAAGKEEHSGGAVKDKHNNKSPGYSFVSDPLNAPVWEQPNEAVDKIVRGGYFHELSTGGVSSCLFTRPTTIDFDFTATVALLTPHHLPFTSVPAGSGVQHS